MRRIAIILMGLALFATPVAQAQKGKNKGGKDKIDIKIKNDDIKIKVKTKDEKIKIDIKDKNGHDHGDHHGKYKNKTVWVFGPGDIYMVKGKSKKQKIVVFEEVCVRLTTNIGFLFGLIGDVRIKLDVKKATLKPERYNKLKMEIDLLDQEVKMIEIKKNKIKLRLAKLKG